MRKNSVKIIALVLCVIFAICCVLFTFIPHLHECTGSECSTCALIESVVDTLAALSIAAVVSPALVLALVFLAHFDTPVSAREITPVGRKVKLSN